MEKVTQWEKLAKTLIDQWVANEDIELDEEGSSQSLVEELADLLAEDPSPRVLEEFLFERDEVAEVFADGKTLAETARQVLAKAQ